MYNLEIDLNTLNGIIIVAITIIIICLLIFVAYIYNTKRKYDSIDNYQKNVVSEIDSYKKIKKEYKKTLEDLGIKSTKGINFIIKILKILKE